jgi:hypothetical protein
MSLSYSYSNKSTVTNLAIDGFCRVTRRRRCRVCGKPDWCGYRADEQISICMRISNGSQGTSRNGGHIYHHGRLSFPTSKVPESKPTPLPIKIAPIEIRNAVYHELIRRSPVLKYRSQLVDGPKGLLSRGLRELELLNYGALPPTQEERASLANTLNEFVTVTFPQYAMRKTHAGVVGVPGFWQDSFTAVQLWKPRDYNMPLLVIPYRDELRRIQACQLQLQPEDIATNKKKYRWLASPFESGGVSSGTPIHFTFKPATLQPGQTVVITEGALKADTLVSLRPKAHVVAMSGVSCSHAEIIAAVRPYNVLIAFDADYKTNPAVTRQLARLIAARERDVAAHHIKTSTRIVTWVGCKGIDDAIRANICLKTMTILDWISVLDERLLRETWTAFGHCQYSPTPSIKPWVRNHSIF